MKQTIGEFLLRRIQEAGVEHIFGVPGDYNLELMQQLEDRGEPKWIGNCNELNASYATDAYARLNGIGAMIVTNGVGALSAINGIAGAYSEHVPVICVCGSIPRKAIQRGDLMHHTLADREKGNFYRAFAEVTIAQAQIVPENAVLEIDRLILTAWRRKLPVYLELPSDIAYLEVDVPAERLMLTMVPSDADRLQACANLILTRLKSSKSPALLLDLDTERFHVCDQIGKLADKFQMNVAVMSTSKGAFPETSPLFAGMYAGLGSSPGTREAIEGSDCLLTIGFRRIESTVGFFTDKLPESAIHLNATYVDADRENFQGVDLAEILSVLVAQAPTAWGKTQSPSREAIPVFVPSDDPLNQESYWQSMPRFLRPNDVIIAEDGTSIIGAGQLRLPEGCKTIMQAVWGSIGYATPALLGSMIAMPERRHILFTGEGSLQLTVQEISTMLRHGLKPFIFVINNDGYTIERTILGKDAQYNDVAKWQYSELPRVFTRDRKPETYIVRTSRELQTVLDASHSDLVLVEAIMDKYDSPIDLIRGGHAFAETDYGPRGPQSRPGAQISLPK